MGGHRHRRFSADGMSALSERHRSSLSPDRTAERDRVKALESFIEDVRSYNDGCGCCGSGTSVISEFEVDKRVNETSEALKNESME